jgi:hypothetical protein
VNVPIVPYQSFLLYAMGHTDLSSGGKTIRAAELSLWNLIEDAFFK